MEVDAQREPQFHTALPVSVEIDLRVDSEGLAPPKRFLVVANQTTESARPEQLIREMVAKHPFHFHMVMPQSPSSTLHVEPAG